MKQTTVFHNIGQLVQVDLDSLPGVCLREHCALLVKGGHITRVVKETDLEPLKNYGQAIDLKGRAVVPGLVDCHTHLLYGGDSEHLSSGNISPSAETAAYRKATQKIVKATRLASEKELTDSAKKRMQRMMAHGTTAFEIKSGFGLDLATEHKMLKAGRRLAKSLKVPVTLDYYGAHLVPEKQKREDYLETVLESLHPLWDIADGVDILIDDGAFDPKDMRKLFLQAKLQGFALNAHVEQRVHHGGCLEAAKLGALTVAHLEHANPKDVRALREHGVTAVLLPATSLVRGAEKRPLVHALMDAGVTIALATDHGPVTSPTYSMQSVVALATQLYRISPEQALAAATLGGAVALGQYLEYGGLLPKQRADFLVLKTSDFRDLAYHLGENLVEQVFLLGNKVRTKNNW